MSGLFGIIFVCVLAITTCASSAPSSDDPHIGRHPSSIHKSSKKTFGEGAETLELLYEPPTVCKYLITYKYSCHVPKKCNNTDVRHSCTEVVNGTWSDADNIVHYYQVCIFTDHFSTCHFAANGTYVCRMQWEQTHHPEGLYRGSAATGYVRQLAAENDVNVPHTGHSSSTSRQKQRVRRSAAFRRIRREGGGTC